MKRVSFFVPAYIAFFVALLSLLGSLFFSEIMKLAPCSLCWYQRILMYPLVIIFFVGIMRKDKYVHQYALPLSIVGFFVALYHNFLYLGYIPEVLQPCVNGISCKAQQLKLFGFITIPLLSLIAFATIISCMLVYRKYLYNREYEND
jgi:disulfide bond formation protein DsbB